MSYLDYGMTFARTSRKDFLYWRANRGRRQLQRVSAFRSRRLRGIANSQYYNVQNSQRQLNIYQINKSSQQTLLIFIQFKNPNMKPDQDDSVNVVQDFIFQLSRSAIHPRDSNGYNYGNNYDLLEYSADSELHQNILQELSYELEQQPIIRPPSLADPKFNNNVVLPAQLTVQQKEQQKRRQRRGIFDKYKNNNKEVNQPAQQGKDLMSKFDEIFSNNNLVRSEVKKIQSSQSLFNPINLAPNSQIKNQTSESRVTEGGTHHHKRIFERMHKDKQQIKSVITSKPSTPLTLVSQSSVNTFKEPINKTPVINNNFQEDSLIIDEKMSGIFDRNAFVESIDKNAYIDLRESKDMYEQLLKQRIFGNTSISIIVPEPESSKKINNLNSSLTNLILDLPQYQFTEPVAENTVPELFRQCHRLNSVSLNYNSPAFSIFAIKHKENLRSLTFQLLMATQVLQNFNEQLMEKQKKQKKLITNFQSEAYRQGEWLGNTVKNIQIIRPVDNFQRRIGDYIQMKQTLKSSIQILKYITDFIEQFRVELSEQFKKKYRELRNSLHDIYTNLRKISEDLYMKSVTQYLPNHYYQFYQFLRNNIFIGKNLAPQELKNRIEERQMLLLRIDYLKNEYDPLSISQVSIDIQAKAKAELNTLKSMYNNTRKKLLSL